jgi:small subunit ribosomal protein S17
MTENEQNQNDEQTPEAAADEAAEQAPAQAPAEDAAAEETPPEEPAAEEPAAEEGPADEPVAAEPAAAAAQAEPAEEPEPLSPKERRKISRSTHTGERGPQRSPEERTRERAERRRAKAQRRRVYRQRVRERRASEAPRADALAPETKPTGIRKVRQGVVVSDKADKTIKVRIDVVRQHRMYKKIVRASSTLHAHDENNEAHVGDTVRVVESRPLSRTKRWRLTEILDRAR